MGPEVALTTGVCTGKLWSEIPCKNSGFVLSSNFQQFSRREKRLENGDKVSWKNRKKSWVFLKLQQIVFYNWIFFRFGQILFFSPICFQPTCIMKKALFLRLVRCLLITDLFDNLESGKRNYCLGKKSGKSLEFISWYLCKALTVVKKRIS